MGALAISVRPLNDHELAIARTVDRLTTEGSLHRTPIPKIAGALDFMMHRSDSEFLVSYVRWRMVNPIAKPGPVSPAESNGIVQVVGSGSI